MPVPPLAQGGRKDDRPTKTMVLAPRAHRPALVRDEQHHGAGDVRMQIVPDRVERMRADEGRRSVSKILVFDLSVRLVVKAPEYADPIEIGNRLNADVALDMANARILDIETRPSTVKVIDGWEKGD